MSMASNSAAQASDDTCKAQFVLRWVTSSHFYPFSSHWRNTREWGDLGLGKKGFSEEIKLRLECFVKRFSVTILYLVHLFGTINRVTSHDFVVPATLVYFLFFSFSFLLRKELCSLWLMFFLCMFGNISVFYAHVLTFSPFFLHL